MFRHGARRSTGSRLLDEGVAALGASVYTPEEGVAASDKRVTYLQLPFNLLDSLA
jgi:hypothetical protein